MNDIIERIRQQLKKNANAKTKESGQSFFKEKIKLYGVKTPIVGKIGKEYFREIKNRNKAEIFGLCDKLWQSGYLEESFIACNWSYFVCKDYEQKDFKVFEKWVNNYVNNWASCDTFCNHTVGAFVEMYPDYLLNLKKWAKLKKLWVRRAAAVSLIVPARRGKFLKDIFEIADILLLDEEDMVQKGYGWMLKVASQTHQKEVFDYVMKNKIMMPRTALRYAIEKMPKKLKKKVMKK
jgi:3-methyladenine DNA glycosylase AlkD